MMLREIVQVLLLLLAAICFALAFFDRTFDGHSFIAAGLFCWVVAVIVIYARFSNGRVPR